MDESWDAVTNEVRKALSVPSYFIHLASCLPLSHLSQIWPVAMAKFSAKIMPERAPRLLTMPITPKGYAIKLASATLDAT
jgi:hypothetical protein